MNWTDEYLQERGITWEIGPQISKDNNGNVYRTLVIGGVKTEGLIMPLLATSEESAKHYYLLDLAQFIGDCKHIIWRTQPELIKGIWKATGKGARNQEPLELWSVWSRLFCYLSPP